MLGNTGAAHQHMAGRTHQRKVGAGRVVTSDRVARLYRLLALLAQNPVARPALLRRLGMTQRSFYRDIELLRSIGIPVATESSHYTLEIEFDLALERLPFPDPLLTLGEAIRLAKGRSAAHKTLQGRVNAIVKPGKRTKSRRKR